MVWFYLHSVITVQCAFYYSILMTFSWKIFSENEYWFDFVSRISWETNIPFSISSWHPSSPDGYRPSRKLSLGCRSSSETSGSILYWWGLLWRGQVRGLSSTRGDEVVWRQRLCDSNWLCVQAGWFWPWASAGVRLPSCYGELWKYHISLGKSARVRWYTSSCAVFWANSV